MSILLSIDFLESFVLIDILDGEHGFTIFRDFGWGVVDGAVIESSFVVPFWLFLVIANSKDEKSGTKKKAFSFLLTNIKILTNST